MPPYSAPPPPSRRRVLYIRHPRGCTITEAFRLNQDEWHRALSALADVTLIESDFDLDALCTRHQSDFIVYESPLYFAHPLHITSPRAHPHIPRIGFFMQDPISAMRTPFLRMVDHLDIQWIFTHLPEALLRQSPELAARVLSVSLLFDDTIFHDYGLDKDIPVSVFGGTMIPEIYRWRADIGAKLATSFPTLLYTHPGYLEPVPRHKFAVTGEAYARLLNRSYFSLADTTRLDYPVRKHLEIPACGSVLVAPNSDVLRAYGFIDGENCLMGEGSALLDKIAATADDRDLYDRIRQSGYDLVHKRFTAKSWRGILDFYECLRCLGPHETIRQEGILGPFVVVSATPPNAPPLKASYPDSEVSTLLASWRDALCHENGLQSASEDFLKIPDWMPHMEEPLVLLALFVLLKGDAHQAKHLLLAPQKFRSEHTGYKDFDPEEITWLSLVAALTGDQDVLKLTQTESPKLNHVGLRRLQWLGERMASSNDLSSPPLSVLNRRRDDSLSVHWTGQLPIDVWVSLVKRILAAHGHS